MSKRFTDTEKWERPWFRTLSLQYKLFWIFVLDKCDIAGVWYVDMELASFLISTKIDRAKAEAIFEKQIEVRGDRWLIKDFVNFQYGKLQESNNIYRNVMAKMSSFDEGAIEGASKPLKSPSQGAKDKDKDIPSFLSVVVPGEGVEGVQELAVAKEKPTHVEFVERFKASYESMAGQPFKYGQAQFVIAARLIKDHGLETCVEKAKILGMMCRDRSVWFTREGWGAFSLEKLSGQWNAILEGGVPETPEQKKKAEEEKERLKWEKHNEIVRNAIGDKPKRRDW